MCQHDIDARYSCIASGGNAWTHPSPFIKQETTRETDIVYLYPQDRHCTLCIPLLTSWLFLRAYFMSATAPNLPSRSSWGDVVPSIRWSQWMVVGTASEARGGVDVRDQQGHRQWWSGTGALGAEMLKRKIGCAVRGEQWRSGRIVLFATKSGGKGVAVCTTVAAREALAGPTKPGAHRRWWGDPRR